MLKNFTFASINECGTKLEGERVGTIDRKKHDPEGTTLPNSRLQVDTSGAPDVVVVKRVQNILRPKSVAGSDGRDDLLGERSSLTNMLERFLRVLGDKLIHESKSDGNHGDNGRHGECEFPLPDKGEDKTGEESGQETGGQGDLFGNTLLDEVWMKK